MCAALSRPRLCDRAVRASLVTCVHLSHRVPRHRSSQLQKYDLPTPQSIFELSYFRERPDAFYRLCAELWPDHYAPTPTHQFIAELHSRGLLRRCFTQNIDSLEAAAHLPREMIVAAHGNFDRCSCIETGASVAVEEVRQAIAHGRDGDEGWLAMRDRHGGLVKPDIVFFGEQLPERFFQCAESDFAECDLLIILGTSLKVHPFASLVGLVREDVPRLLVNREEVGTDAQPMFRLLGFIDDKALDFDEATRFRDALFLGDCDEGVRQLAAQLDAAATAAGTSAGTVEAGRPQSWVAAVEQRVAAQPPPTGPRELPPMVLAPPAPPPSAAEALAGGDAGMSEAQPSEAPSAPVEMLSVGRGGQPRDQPSDQQLMDTDGALPPEPKAARLE